MGHGQMDEHELEQVMLDFVSGKDDVLVCTTIIESGLDIPNANTIIIDDATASGWRSFTSCAGAWAAAPSAPMPTCSTKAISRMTDEAQQRLEAIHEANELGAGFRIAMRDLEIRGAGDLLGASRAAISPRSASICTRGCWSRRSRP